MTRQLEVPDLAFSKWSHQLGEIDGAIARPRLVMPGRPTRWGAAQCGAFVRALFKGIWTVLFPHGL
jgi:hypothetical protein